MLCVKCELRILSFASTMNLGALRQKLLFFSSSPKAVGCMAAMTSVFTLRSHKFSATDSTEIVAQSASIWLPSPLQFELMVLWSKHWCLWACYGAKQRLWFHPLWVGATWVMTLFSVQFESTKLLSDISKSDQGPVRCIVQFRLDQEQ